MARAWWTKLSGSNRGASVVMALLKLFQSLTKTAAAGSQNNVTPDSGNLQTVNRLKVDTTAGNASFTGLTAGVDGQLLWLLNTGANLLTLNLENAASTITNRFSGAADLTIPAGGSLLIYYDTAVGAGTPGRWVIGV